MNDAPATPATIATESSESGVGRDFLQALPIAAGHPALAGHFPGRPIVPGVVLLDQVLLALSDWLAPLGQPADCEIATAKFLSPVAPGEALQLQATRQSSQGVETLRFDIHGGDPAHPAGWRKIASGSVRLCFKSVP